MSSSRPPAEHFIIQYDNEDNNNIMSITNLTYTLNKVVPGRSYTISVTAVNILGPDPYWESERACESCDYYDNYLELYNLVLIFCL